MGGRTVVRVVAGMAALALARPTQQRHIEQLLPTRAGFFPFPNHLNQTLGRVHFGDVLKVGCDPVALEEVEPAVALRALVPDLKRAVVGRGGVVARGLPKT